MPLKIELGCILFPLIIIDVSVASAYTNVIMLSWWNNWALEKWLINCSSTHDDKCHNLIWNHNCDSVKSNTKKHVITKNCHKLNVYNISDILKAHLYFICRASLKMLFFFKYDNLNQIIVYIDFYCLLKWNFWYLWYAVAGIYNQSILSFIRQWWLLKVHYGHNISAHHSLHLLCFW